MLKAAAAAAAVFLAAGPAPARADSLLTGAIRDRSGVAVRGALVTAFDAAGRPDGSDVAEADGTFAIAASAPPAAVAVTCDYCRAVHQAVDPASPVVVIIERYTAVTAAGPSAADIRALPYRSAPDIASLVPFTAVTGGRISDRGLDYAGATLIDGVPLYNVGDGSSLGDLIPAHAIAGVTALSPLAAPRYGGYADAGVYDLRLHDTDDPTSRLDTGDASDAVVRFDAPDLQAGYAASSDVDDDRQAVSAGGALALAGGRLSIDAIDLTDLTDHASGVGLGYETQSRRFATSASVDASQSDAASFVSAAVSVRDRGPLGLTLGARAERATSSTPGVAGSQFDGAVYAAASRQTGVNALTAVAAFDRGSDGGIAGGAPAASFVGSLADDVRLGAHWSAHAGIDSNLRIPTFSELAGAAPADIGGDRSLLFEQFVTYEDLRGVRVTGMAYTQHASGSVDGSTNGVGLDTAWQIAPQLTLRGWLLRANQSALPVVDPNAPYSPLTPAGSAGSLTRQLVWLTYGTGVRVDALLRGSGLEGDVRIPFGSAYAFALGSATYNGRRTMTFGITLR